jgi:hypothetical protein
MATHPTLVSDPTVIYVRHCGFLVLDFLLFSLISVLFNYITPMSLTGNSTTNYVCATGVCIFWSLFYVCVFDEYKLHSRFYIEQTSPMVINILRRTIPFRFAVASIVLALL